MARQAVKDKVFEAYSGLLLLLSASQAEYGEVNKQLTMQFSMGTDQYPKTLTAAVDILANHKPDNKSAKAKSERSKSSNRHLG